MTEPGIVCGNCGTANAANAVVCVSCGALLAAYVSPLGSAAMPVETIPASEPEPDDLPNRSRAPVDELTNELPEVPVEVEPVQPVPEIVSPKRLEPEIHSALQSNISSFEHPASILPEQSAPPAPGERPARIEPSIHSSLQSNTSSFERPASIIPEQSAPPAPGERPARIEPATHNSLQSNLSSFERSAPVLPEASVPAAVVPRPGPARAVPSSIEPSSRPQKATIIPNQQKQYPTLRQLVEARKRPSTGRQSSPADRIRRIQETPPFNIIVWSVFAIILSCVLMGVGSSFNGGGILVGIGFLLFILSIVGMIIGITRFARRRK